MEENPWVKIEGQFKEGQIIKGIINKITSFGAFVDIFPGVEAFSLQLKWPTIKLILLMY